MIILAVVSTMVLLSESGLANTWGMNVSSCGQTSSKTTATIWHSNSGSPYAKRKYSRHWRNVNIIRK